MKAFVAIRWVLVVLVFVYVIWVTSGSDKHYVDVYINSQCKLVTLDNDAEIPELFFFPGDFVIWNNMSGDEVELDFPDGWFSEDPVIVPKDQRVIVEVVRDAPGSSTISVICDGGGSGAPAVKIGDDP